jgi:nitrate/TMAO reductase-like tetraheme cytochrome c subunit
MRSFIISLTRDPLSLAGATITTAAACLFCVFFALEVLGSHANPYSGILAFLILPGLFLLGLALIPFGVVRGRRRAQRAAEHGEAPPTFPVIDLRRSNVRRNVLIFLVLSFANVVILAVASYKGMEVMDSTEFCGATCHSVMHPEYTAYKRSPHARVNCVECHIGPGASWFVRSKLSGAWQVVAVAFDLYPRPIATPIENLRPARETCEQCHWPTKFVGDRLKIITHYDDDEPSTELKTVLVLRVGGEKGTKSHGIHWHVDPDVRIRYRADASRESIHEVELTREDGTVVLYRKGESPPDPAQAGDEAWRVMDCVDCHNRPTHVYFLPEQAVDDAIEHGQISRELPFVRREALRVLRAEYASHDEAAAGIAESLRAYYAGEHPQAAAQQAGAIATAADVLGRIYATNVFPAMNVQWGTYPNHIGHQYFDGCFRCHDDEHKSEDGQSISQDCDTCHSLLAIEEQDPEILAQVRP